MFTSRDVEHCQLWPLGNVTRLDWGIGWNNGRDFHGKCVGGYNMHHWACVMVLILLIIARAYSLSSINAFMIVQSVETIWRIMADNNNNCLSRSKLN